MVDVSFTSEQSGQDNGEQGAEGATETVELSRTILGLIDAYRMGAALDAQDLYPARSASSPSPEPVPATS